MPDTRADWLVEEGIGEHRAARIEGDRIVATRVEWLGMLAAGWVIDTRLVSRASGSSRGTAMSDDGEEVIVDRLPREASEGARLRIGVTRGAFYGPGRLKRAQGRPSEAPLARPSLAQRLREDGDVQTVRCFPGSDWDELIDEALAGEIDFPGGMLVLAPTAAMTTIDIDGDIAPRALALGAVQPLADALRRLDISGSVAVDFPTLAEKTDRREVDEALGTALSGWPHERTAINGFGLVQIVSRLERPSLLQLAEWRRAGFIWRRLLRGAEGLTGAGTLELSIHPALERVIEPAHLASLERRSGRSVRISKSPNLALEGPHAQIVNDDR